MNVLKNWYYVYFLIFKLGIGYPRKIKLSPKGVRHRVFYIKRYKVPKKLFLSLTVGVAQGVKEGAI
jgi:hypothetical protein